MPTLHLAKFSPPVRAVQMTAKALDITIDEKKVSLEKGEQFSPEYLKLNLQHTVPTLVDDEFVIWDSHAIMAYLVSKHSKDSTLYPVNELKKKAVVDQRLHFDSGVAFATLRDVVKPILRFGKTRVEDTEVDAINQVYSFLEAFLETTLWMAGDTVTIADYSLFSTVTSLNVIVPVDAIKYSKLIGWIRKVEQLPESAENQPGLEVFVNMIKAKLG